MEGLPVDVLQLEAAPVGQRAVQRGGVPHLDPLHRLRQHREQRGHSVSTLILGKS